MNFTTLKPSNTNECQKSNIHEFLKYVINELQKSNIDKLMKFDINELLKSFTNELQSFRSLKHQ